MTQRCGLLCSYGPIHMSVHNDLKLVHGIISVNLIMLTHESLQTSCYMNDTWIIRGHNMVSTRNCLLWYLFWLCPLLCLLCSKDLCVPILPTSMHSILWNQNGLQILGDIRHAVHHCLSFFVIVMMKRTTWNGQNKAKGTQRQTSWKAKISCLVGYKNKTVPRITARHSRLSRAG